MNTYKDVVIINDKVVVNEAFININKEFKKINTFSLDINKLLANKVDKISGKSLSQEDFTTSLKRRIEALLALPIALDLDNIKLDLKLADTITRYKVFSYDINNNITNLQIYKDDTMNNLLFTVTYNYTLNELTSLNVIRASDNYSYTKEFEYDINGNLTNINII